MIAGVSYMYFVLNSVLNLFGFIWTGNFLVLLVLAPFVHFIGMMICRDEPRSIELLMLKASKGLRCKNRNTVYKGANSYDVF